MRIFFIFLLFSSTAFSQVRPDGFCTATTITTALPTDDLTFDCDTLTIGPGTHVIPPNNANDFLRIDVVGDVTIAAGAVIVLAGGNGGPAADAEPGGIAGPGGSGGGDNTAFGPSDAPDPPNGGLQGTSAGPGPCGAGGGGGGFAVAGTDGSDCTVLGGNGGDAYLNLAITFRGGFGGGAGGTPSFVNPILSATGGGGGGAIWINGTGNITINGNIDVRGGTGGSAAAASNAGGGGGGSGGAIRIQTTGQIVNNGTFFLAGGPGGNGNGNGANGGAGSPGIFELQDADNIIFGVGTGANGILPGGGSSSETLRSDISCGTVKMKDEDHLLFQTMIGFMMVVLLSKILGRFRRSA